MDRSTGARPGPWAKVALIALEGAATTIVPRVQNGISREKTPFGARADEA